MEHIDETFLTQVIDDLTRGGTLLDRIFSNREEVLGKVKSGSNLDCCEQEIVIVDFMIPRGENKANSIITILIVGLLRDLLQKIP